MKIYFCTHGGGTNWGLPNNIAAIRESLKRKHIVGVEMDLFISSDGVIFPGNPFIKSDPDSWGNSWLGLTKHPGEMSWAELSKLRYELGKAEEELSLINESSAKIERVPENYSLHSIDTLPSSPKEFHFHIEMPTTTNAKSQIADMAKFLGEWLSAGKNLQGEIYVHSSSDDVLAEFARVEGVRLILGIGKGNTDRIKQLTDKLERKLNLISTSNNTEIADVIAFLKSDLSMPLPLMLFSPKSQRSSEEHKKVLEQSRFLRDQDYFLVNQGIRVSEYAESIRAA